MAVPLRGLKMIEAASASAPPGLWAAIGMCGRMAADLGADLTRVVVTDTQGLPHPFLDAGKTILRMPPAAAVLADLVRSADVLICDPALLDELALAPRAVRAIISMDGGSLPYQDSEFTIEARAGLLDIVGDPQRSPLRLGGHQTAYAAGLSAFTGMVAALCQQPLDRARDLHTSLLETAIWLNWKSLAVAQRTGKAVKRAGPNAEWPVLPCIDGHVVVVHRNQEWQRLMDVVGNPLMREARFQSLAGRRQHRSELNAMLAEFFATLTRQQVHELSLRHKLPFGAVWSPAELLQNPQMLERQIFRPTEIQGRSVSLPRLPVVWHGASA